MEETQDQGTDSVEVPVLAHGEPALGKTFKPLNASMMMAMLKGMRMMPKGKNCTRKMAGAKRMRRNNHRKNMSCQQRRAAKGH